MLRLAEDNCADAEGAASRSLQSALDLHSGVRGLQSGAHAKPGRSSSSGVTQNRGVVFRSMELNPEDTKTPEITLFEIINDEKRKENHVKDQFFRSLLDS